jgi:hypothetical protein
MGALPESLVFVDGDPIAPESTYAAYVAGLSADGRGVWSVAVSATDAVLEASPVSPRQLAAAPDGGMLALLGVSGSIIVDGDGVAGTDSARSDGLLVKIAPDGTVEWSRHGAAGVESIFAPSAVATRADGDILVTGGALGTVTWNGEELFDPAAGTYSPFLLHLDGDGDVVRASLWPAASPGADAKFMIARDDGATFVAGSYAGSFPDVQLSELPAPTSTLDVFLVELGPDDVPVRGSHFGSPERHEWVSGLADLGGDLFVMGVSSPSEAFPLSTARIDFADLESDEPISSQLGLFAGRVTSDAETGRWIEYFNTSAPAATSIDTGYAALRGDDVSFTVYHRNDVLTMIGSTAFSHVDAFSLLLDGTTGDAIGALRWGDAATHRQYLGTLSTACGDLVFGSYSGPFSFEGKDMEGDRWRGFVGFVPGGQAFDALP